MLSSVIAIAALFAALAAYLFFRQHERAQWDRRPERLCLVCEAVHQPERISNAGLRCPTCTVPGPVLLDSAEAEAHRQAKAAGVVAKPNSKVWVPRPKDDITRYG